MKLPSCWMRRVRMYKKIAIGLSFGVVIALGTLYFAFFRQPPADDILAANKARRSQGANGARSLMRAPKPTGPNANDYYYYFYEDALEPAPASKAKWDRYIEENGMVEIGQVYDTCDGEDKRLNIGRGILLQDPVTGGVMTRTFLNVTIDHEVTGGEMHILSYYNGKELVNNIWELCTAEEGTEEPHVIVCPIAAGTHSAKKDLPIPGYLPKGRYSTRVWVLDQDGKELGCSFSDFTM